MAEEHEAKPTCDTVECVVTQIVMILDVFNGILFTTERERQCR